MLMMWTGQNKGQRLTRGPDSAWDRQMTGALAGVEVAVDTGPPFVVADDDVIAAAVVVVVVGYDGGESQASLLVGSCCTSNQYQKLLGQLKKQTQQWHTWTTT